jgi:pentapeptide MXKDX repeat protein
MRSLINITAFENKSTGQGINVVLERLSNVGRSRPPLTNRFKENKISKLLGLAVATMVTFSASNVMADAMKKDAMMKKDGMMKKDAMHKDKMMKKDAMMKGKK